MEYLRIDGDFPRLPGSAVTLGKFDGIHRGHQKLVKSILEQKEQGLQTVLFAFDVSSKMILSHEERAHLVEKMGIDVLLECPLTDRIRHMKAESFVSEILAGDLHASFVAVGEDYHFGYERKGNPGLLKDLGKKYGFETMILPKEMDGRRKISSTYIREELNRGNMEKFRDLMGMNFILEGTVEHGMGLGHKKLLPTTNLIPPEEKLMPPNGVYTTISHFGDVSYQGITNIGYKPTVEGNFLGVETHLFDCSEDLYGQPCRVEFYHYQRPESRFASIEALRQQLMQDVVRGHEYFDKK
jgi:riboflavin kinase/FMN adenylyltransferase